MAKDLTSAEDTQEALDSQEGSGFRSITIDIGKTPIYILTAKYEFGFIHWVKLGTANVPVVCAAGKDGGGFAPDDCQLCEKTAGHYKAAKKLEKAKKPEAAAKEKKKGNDIRAKWAAQFIVAKGEFVKTLIQGVKKDIPNFDDVEVGILSMTQKQYQDLIDLRDDDDYPYVKSGEDLINRMLLLDKAKRKAKGKKKLSRYPTIVIKPAKRPTDPPVVFDDLEDKDELLQLMEDSFSVDTEAVDRVYKALTDDSEDTEEEFQVEEEAATEAESDYDLGDSEPGSEFDEAASEE